jgi:hypothetical protein
VSDCEICGRHTGEETVVRCGVCGMLVCQDCVDVDLHDLCEECAEERISEDGC